MSNTIFSSLWEFPPIKSNLAQYVTLGRSGLRVSPICLGTMNFGGLWEKFLGECPDEEAIKMLDLYTDKGGNFLDTANVYHMGKSEELVGKWMQKKGNRRDLVIATKFTAPMKPGSINSAGNSRKNMHEALDDSLRRLGTNYVDLLYVHYPDFLTPIDEIMRSFDDLVRSGKVSYIGVSDFPAWQVAKANTMADLRGWTQFTAYTGRYHLGDRDLERDVLPMCRDFGIAVCPWGSLGQGKYTGKYKRGEAPKEGGRAGVTMTEKDYDIAEAVAKIATETKRTNSQVALRWVLQQKGIVSPVIGGRTVGQLEDTLGALDFTLSKEQMEVLNKVSSADLGFPHNFIGVSFETCPWIRTAGRAVSYTKLN